MIWQPFVNWHYAFAGIVLGWFSSARGSPWLLSPLLAPSAAPHCLFRSGHLHPGLPGPGLCCPGPRVLGYRLGDDPSLRIALGERAGSLLNSWAVPLLSGSSHWSRQPVSGLGGAPPGSSLLRSHRRCGIARSADPCFSLGVFSIAVFALRAIKNFSLGETSLFVLGACVTGGLFFLYRRLIAFLVEIPLQDDSHRFPMLLALAFGCVGIFLRSFPSDSGHSVSAPLLFVLTLVFFAET